MGREIRRVPPNWEHPSQECTHSRPCFPKCYLRMFDNDYETAKAEWAQGFLLWESVPEERPSQIIRYYWEYHGPPPNEDDKHLYRPKFTEEPTWFQVYQTVSEGTPVTPPFATAEELARYLNEHGDFWYQKPTYENALAFVTQGWAPSMERTSEGEFLGSYSEKLSG